MLFSKVLSQDTSDAVVTLDDLMEYSRITDTYDEIVVQGVLDGAIDRAEEFLNRKLYPTDMIGEMEQWKNKVRLPYPPIKEVTTITATNSLGEEVVVEGFKFSSVRETVTIPEDYSDHTDFVINYHVGYQSVDEVPNVIKAGIRQLASTMYETRTDVVAGVSLADVSTSALQLLKTKRVQSL